MSRLRSMWRWLGGGKRKAAGNRLVLPRIRSKVSHGRFRPTVQKSSRLSVESLDGRILPSITEFPIPTADTQPLGITRGPDGNLWFAELHAIGRITPAGVVTEFSQGLSPNGAPLDITAGPDGNLWFTEGTDRIGRITPAGVITEFVIPQAVGQLPGGITGITTGPDGKLWFTESIGAIGRFNPTAGSATVFDTTAGGTRPSSPGLITRGPDGNLWFTDSSDKIGRITTAGVITEFSAGISPGSEPAGITAGPDGNLWFTEDAGNRIGRITTAGVVTEFTNGLSPLSAPPRIVAGPDGNLWFTEQTTDRIGRITPAGVVTEFAAGITPDAVPAGITVGPDGNIWFTELNGNRIGRLNVAQVGATTTTALVTSTANAVFGQSFTLTATVTSQSGTPTGSVTFLDGQNNVLGTAPVNAAGQATLTLSLGVGAGTLVASYLGNNTFAPSRSAFVAETVTPAATTVALTSSANPVAVGQAVTFTATVAAVAPGAGTPTLNVTFRDGNVILGIIPVAADGTARITGSFGAAGNHAITAFYGGDPNFQSSTSPVLNEVVGTPAAPKVTGVVVNGVAAQRSLVTQLRVAFDQHVTLPATPATAFRLVRQSDGAAVLVNTAVDDTGPGTIVTLTFVGGALEGASLADGRYTLTVLSARVGSVNGALDGDGDGQAGGDFVLVGSPANGLFRLFGDVNGDGAVNGLDLTTFRNVFGTVQGSPAYLAFLDANGDGAINGLDLTAFRGRFGVTI